MLELLMIAAIAAGVVLLVRSLAAVFDWVLLGREPALLRPLLAPLHEWRDARRPAPPPLPAVLHELELARLAAELRRVRDSNQPGLATRVRACTAAYDDVLLRCAQDLGVPVPAPPLTRGERLEVETHLLSQGIRW